MEYHVMLPDGNTLKKALRGSEETRQVEQPVYGDHSGVINRPRLPRCLLSRSGKVGLVQQRGGKRPMQGNHLTD